MNIQILPNWFKKIALIVFLVTSIIPAADGLINGVRGDRYSYNESKTHGIVSIFVGGEKVIHIFEIISILAILAYMITKEKIEDDYIKLLRLESYQLTFIIIIVISFVFFFFNKEFVFGISDSLSLFLWLYLIIFFFKKRLY